MSYEPTVWKDGDLVTSAKLNKLEQGVAASGGGIFVLHESDAGVLDKTWKEINDAIQTNAVVLCAYSSTQSTNDWLVETNISIDDNEYQVGFTSGQYYIADSENGYPAIGKG